MVQSSVLVTIEEERRREANWRMQTAEVTRLAAERYHEIASVLGLDPKVTEAFVSTAMEATRQYQRGYMYANYEKRTGHPYPDEGRDAEENTWEANWAASLEWLRNATGA